jgi:hypothetical protein
MLPKNTFRKQKLLRAIDTAPDKFATNVKYLCFPFQTSPYDAIKIFKVCKRVLYIAWWMDSLPPELNDAMTSQRPTRLSLRLGPHYSRLGLLNPFFADITHLELIVAIPEMPSIDLHELPRLTHLRIINPIDNVYINSFVRGSLARCRGLQACLLRHATAPAVIQPYDEVRDNRVVMIPYKDPASEWEAVINGLPDMWTAADTFIQQRQRQGGII